MDAHCYFAMGLFIIQGFIGLGLVYQAFVLRSANCFPMRWSLSKPR